MAADFLGPNADDPPYRVSAEALAHFDEHGFVILHGLLESRELEEMARRIDGILDGTYPVDRAAFKVGNASSGGKEDNGRLTQQVMATQYPILDPVLRAYSEHPRLESAAAQLMRSDHAGIFQQQALIKRPGEENPTPWHQDDFYFETDDPAVTAWIPLEPVSERNGTLRVVPGSHRQTIHRHEAAAGNSEFKVAQLDIPASQTFAIVMPLGGVSFHHKRTLHGSLPNVGDTRRIALAQHYGGGDVEYMRSKWKSHKRTG
ncbi:MAG TPA: phytanoyl-CoA dioxygenase family protein [Steroidobacteraceae bacterium]|jgi:ectoine hydroxylase-related dioxygenase (phytanoyl-CoA dioxygenase family)|nr:phytanoyl-CoA dioxygenase family protein [Steroidobacteraceae bacterium]